MKFRVTVSQTTTKVHIIDIPDHHVRENEEEGCHDTALFAEMTLEELSSHKVEMVVAANWEFTEVSRVTA